MMAESIRSNNTRKGGSSTPAISKILVCARLRPIIPEDHKTTITLRNAPEICVHLKNDGQTIKLIQNLYSSRKFKVDHTFDTASSQLDVYHRAFKPIVQDVLKGYHGTIIAYGQTGSGYILSQYC